MIRPEDVPEIATRLAKETEALNLPADELLRRWDKDLHDVYKYMPTDRFVRLYDPWEVNICILDISECDEDRLYYSGENRDGAWAVITIPVAWVKDPEGYFAEARKEQVQLEKVAKRKERDQVRKELADAQRKIEELTRRLGEQE